MVAMSACHETRRQVVEHGRRSPRETGASTVTGFVSHHEGRES